MPELLLVTLACPLLSPEPRADLVASKSGRWIGLYRQGQLQQGACWPIALGRGAPEGTKRAEGDRATPEGLYRTSDKPWSSFPGAIAVHYPGVEDARRARREGRIDAATEARILAAQARGTLPPQDTALGGQILIHGGGAATDWTLGCIALEDEHLDELRAGLRPGMRGFIAILP